MSEVAALQSAAFGVLSDRHLEVAHTMPVHVAAMSYYFRAARILGYKSADNFISALGHGAFPELEQLDGHEYRRGSADRPRQQRPTNTATGGSRRYPPPTRHSPTGIRDCAGSSPLRWCAGSTPTPSPPSTTSPTPEPRN
ncbi:hypothetical protein [Streptomyces sp. NPDC001635]|nr:hypothetical protein E4K10_45715 [Streptomyces sp. T1317-0309]